MLPRKLRLTRAHFALHGSEKRVVSPHFSVSVRPTAVSGGCAAVISKKVAKLSVTRHKLKRRILAVMGPWCGESRSLVVYARPGSAELGFDELSQELEGLLVRALGQIR
ncbi:MAG: ribonuclease P protein component [Parcubacteria bacterium C7867-004]|nr:MAG: ribonuclease P protein component [Parcubacteria bacterium C7867-004]